MMPATIPSPHWAAAYIGDPYVEQDHDCWGFARRVWRERYGLEVPAIAVPDRSLRSFMHAIARHPERRHWIEVPVPVEGDGVLLARGRRDSHVGIWIDADGGGVLHCDDDGLGVVFSSLRALAQAQWVRQTFYRRGPTP